MITVEFKCLWLELPALELAREKEEAMLPASVGGKNATIRNIPEVLYR